MANDTLLAMVEQRLERRFGRPTKDLYRLAARGSLSEPALRRAITWHGKLVEAEDLLHQFDEALLPYLTDEELTPRRATEMAGLAERIIQLQAARESIAMIILEALAPTSTFTTGTTPASAKPTPQCLNSPLAAPGGAIESPRRIR
ncbi:hypothetical protein [Streptomyces hainanensis]|uniref:Uncharacterized protein n=1 Tax=Streptomyces hainanensis TaxID=402648 RepID=A0A4R4T6M4_9ACTN|nr:hypothetical protein [Streptomyces hainanensis]TDC72620.1 hypothetical protein E1283_21280 [Streptomyces hainanensis]